MDDFFTTIILPCASRSRIWGIIAGFKLYSRTSRDERLRKIIGIDAFVNELGKSEEEILEIAKTPYIGLVFRRRIFRKKTSLLI